jgi:hypothetical protein
MAERSLKPSEPVPSETEYRVRTRQTLDPSTSPLGANSITSFGRDRFHALVAVTHKLKGSTGILMGLRAGRFAACGMHDR